MTDKEEYSVKDPVKNSRLDQREKKVSNILIVVIVLALFGGVLYYIDRSGITTVTNDSSSAFRHPKDTPRTPQQPPSDESRQYDLSKPPHKQ